jgi:hypothetical protein
MPKRQKSHCLLDSISSDADFSLPSDLAVLLYVETAERKAAHLGERMKLL